MSNEQQELEALKKKIMGPMSAEQRRIAVELFEVHGRDAIPVLYEVLKMPEVKTDLDTSRYCTQLIKQLTQDEKGRAQFARTKRST